MLESKSQFQMERILRLPDVCHYTGLSRSTIYQKQDPNDLRYDKDFPKKLHLQGTTAVGFLASEIAAWIALQVTHRDGQHA